ncbi:hypothetical protein KVT40_007029 [Elsinoe batatas]|uniref:Uncharacterized protein n=1 Tax=Elsinoe batatas TaxID=2601811 RepID=A0A8K0KZ70_9PEZI|nr:hypothetical protein KVT40_007029 [Elsinoe batatas]
MATPQRLTTVHRLQTAMAASYAGMGAWYLPFPGTVLCLSFRLSFHSIHPTAVLLMRYFGAQAATAGVLLGTAQMTSFSYKVSSLAMVPYIVGPNARGVLMIGNLFFMGGSWWAARVVEGMEKVEGVRDYGARISKNVTEAEVPYK